MAVGGDYQGHTLQSWGWDNDVCIQIQDVSFTSSTT